MHCTALEMTARCNIICTASTDSVCAASTQSDCGVRQHVVCFPQDLELWISKEVLEDGFVLVTRAGRTVQELKVTTKLDVDFIKSAVQKVLQRLA